MVKINMMIYILLIFFVLGSKSQEIEPEIPKSLTILSECRNNCTNLGMIGSLGYINTLNGISCECVYEDNTCCKTELQCVTKYCNRFNTDTCLFVDVVNRCFISTYTNLLETNSTIIHTNPPIVIQVNTSLTYEIMPMGKLKLNTLCKLMCSINNKDTCTCKELFLDELFHGENVTTSRDFNVKALCKMMCFDDDNRQCICVEIFSMDNITTSEIESTTVKSEVSFSRKPPIKVLSICSLLCGSSGGTPTHNGKVCKCPKIDNECCTTTIECSNKYCSDIQPEQREQCTFMPRVNVCYSYKFVKVNWK